MADIIDYINKTTDKTRNYRNVNLFKVPKKEKTDAPNMTSNLLHGSFVQLADLLHLPQDKNSKYALVVVDAFNLACDAEPVYGEKTASSVLKAMKRIYDRNILFIPKIMQVDKGSEFNNAEFIKFFKSHNCYVKFTMTNRHRQNALVEYKNKIIGKMIIQYQNSQVLDKGKAVRTWIKHLPHVVQYINKHKPRPKKLDNTIHVSKESENILPLKTKVRCVLDAPVNTHNDKKMIGTFRSGDLRWKKEVRTIEKVILNPNEPIMYQLNGNDNGIDNRVAYTRQQLQLIHGDEI